MHNLVGKTVLLYNYRNDGEYRVLHVLSVRDTHDKGQRLQSKTRMYNQITRGQHLLTAKDVSRNEVRSYYADHAESIREIGWWGLTWHRLLLQLGYRLEREQE